MQLNRLLGDATMAIHMGKNPNWQPSIDIAKGTPNQKCEECSVLFGLHLPPDPLAEKAVNKCIDFLQYQLDVGYQCAADACEILTDSHAPIWNRAMASMHTTSFSQKGKGSKYETLYKMTTDWWGKQTYLCDLLTVPKGPRHGEVVGVGSRFALGQNLTRDVCHNLISGVPFKKLQGPKFWANALKYQDTYACILIRSLILNGGFKEMKKTPPKMKVTLTVSYYDDGHVSEFPYGIQPGDPSVVWVRYSDGHIGKDEPVPNLGKVLHNIKI